MSSWRLLGELPQGRTREEIRAQSFGDWNPWQHSWNRCAEAGIVVTDVGRSSRARHVPTYWVEHNGEVIKFAADHLDSGVCRFYIPASPTDDGAFETRSPRYEGFWRSSSEADENLPWPVPDATWVQRDAFLDLLGRAEADAQGVAYRGFSSCRLCGCRNGSRSFQLDDWEWPEGFRHYIVDHQVRPSSEFQTFVSRWAQMNPRADL